MHPFKFRFRASRHQHQVWFLWWHWQGTSHILLPDYLWNKLFASYICRLRIRSGRAGRDGVRFEIVGRVRFDKAVRSIKICLGLSGAQRRKLMTTLQKRRRMSMMTRLWCNHCAQWLKTRTRSEMWKNAPLQWHRSSSFSPLTCEDWPLTLECWLSSKRKECRLECSKWTEWEWSMQDCWCYACRATWTPKRRFGFGRIRWNEIDGQKK